MTTTLDIRKPRTARGAALTAAVAGPLFLLLGFAMPADGPPVGTATAAQIRVYALGQGTALRIGTLAGVAAVVVLLMLTAAFAQVVRSALPESMLADLGAGAGYVLAGAYLLTITAAAVPTLLPGLIGTELSAVDDAVLRGWYGLNGVLHLVGDLQMGLMAVVVGTFTIAALRGRLLPRWLSWLGAAITVSAIIGTVGVTLGWGPLYGFWFGGQFGWVLWYPAAGIALGLRERRRSP
ncbi:MAG TPA: hypothetical protein VH502_15915 [Actinoplanes sp.]